MSSSSSFPSPRAQAAPATPRLRPPPHGALGFVSPPLITPLPSPSLHPARRRHRPLPGFGHLRTGPKPEDLERVRRALEARGGARIPENFAPTATAHQEPAGMREWWLCVCVCVCVYVCVRVCACACYLSAAHCLIPHMISESRFRPPHPLRLSPQRAPTRTSRPRSPRGACRRSRSGTPRPRACFKCWGCPTTWTTRPCSTSSISNSDMLHWAGGQVEEEGFRRLGRRCRLRRHRV
jgi:hypothetical protein